MEAARAAAGPAPEEVLLQAPFVTPLPWLLPEGVTELSWDAAVAAGEPLPFSGGAAGRPEARRSTLLLRVSRGLADRVEGAVSAGAQRVDGGGAVAADVRLEVGYAFLGRFDSPRSFAGRLTVKAPTAPDRGGAGTDEADVGCVLVAGSRTRSFGVFGAAGLELLGNPLTNGAQDDVAIYGAGLWGRLGEAWRITTEVEGRAFSRFGNSPATLRLGASGRVLEGRRGSLAAHVSLSAGLNADAAERGWAAGVSALIP